MTSTTMITGPDRNCRHMIVSVLSLRSHRAAGGLRRPSGSRALLAFIARATCCQCAVPEKRPLAFDIDYASKGRHTEDPKGMYMYIRIQGICFSTYALIGRDSLLRPTRATIYTWPSFVRMHTTCALHHRVRSHPSSNFLYTCTRQDDKMRRGANLRLIVSNCLGLLSSLE